jgi:hypothetical protein
MSTGNKTLTPAENSLVDCFRELGRIEKGTATWDEGIKQVWGKIYECPQSLKHLRRLERYDPQDRNDFEVVARIDERIHDRLRGNAIPKFIEKLEDDLYEQSPEQIIVRLNGWLRKLGGFIAQDMFKEITEGRQQFDSLDDPLFNDKNEVPTLGDSQEAPTLNSLNEQIKQDQGAKKADLDRALREYIEADPDGILRGNYPGEEDGDHYKYANLQEVAKRRLLQDSPQTWQAISQGFNVPFSTISSYGNTNLNTVLLWVFIQKIDQHQGKLWWNVIEKDPTNDLKDLHLPNLPACHSQYLAQELLLKSPPKKMSTLAREFKIPTKKLQKFWDEQCLKHLWLMV